jgi:hypothetical protein
MEDEEKKEEEEECEPKKTHHCNLSFKVLSTQCLRKTEVDIRYS